MNEVRPLAEDDYRELLKLALREDIGSGDVTSEALIAAGTHARAKIIAREELILCGHAVARSVFASIDPGSTYTVRVRDGERATDGETVAEIDGSLRAILTGERTALNFLQRLSGVATVTHSVAGRVSGTKLRVLDTRKTTPGWRALEKYAVRVGGGTNHRFGLYDAVLIKNNHIDAAGGDVALAVEKCRSAVAKGMRVQVEVRNIAELEAALRAAPDAILLDNMTPLQLSQAVRTVRESGRSVELEASGGITPETIADFAETGVDFVSLGALTHSARAVDLSLRFVGAAV